MIYTHDEAARIVELFEDVLDQYHIRVPSPEDDQRGPDNEANLYGSVYFNLLDEVELRLQDTIERAKSGEELKTGVFSGNF